MQWYCAKSTKPPMDDPEASQTVLIASAGGNMITGFYMPSEGEWYDFEGEPLYDVAAWTPKPDFSL